ncbi:predicted protein [Chaetoceros tenuissimus]|uniref:Uncharacterized protein n=1 Tax=Chaetoceros tenuissimus TaxID=426638 RepID=A0AAD3GZ14_9STRA|nr:predicted protein [Chaetoceros tenuissimus]
MEIRLMLLAIWFVKMGKCSVYDGKIAKVRGKDSYDIDFDDGDKKKAVPLQNIKAVNVDDIWLYTEDIAEYAIQNGLLETPGLEWAKKYCRNAEIVEI